MWSYAPDRVTETDRTDHRVVLTVLTLLASVAVALLAAGCGSQAESAGAAAPARPGAVEGSGAPDGVSGSSGPGTGEGTAEGEAGPDGPGSRPEQVVAAYFREVNAASVAGRVADVAATTLSGCRSCAKDVAATRQIESRGLHSDVGPLTVTGLVTGEPAGVSVTVTFDLQLAARRLLDHADRETDKIDAGPATTGTAVLTLTPNGWRIRSIDYEPKDPT